MQRSQQQFKINLVKSKLTKREKRQLGEMIIAIILTIPLLLSMIPVFPFTYLTNPWLQLVLATIVIVYPGRGYYKNMYNEIFRWHQLGMNTLIGLGTLLAYGYSIYLIITPQHYHLFFETAATIITILLIGNFVSNRIQKKVSQGIEQIVTLKADEANLVDKNKNIKVINTNDVQVNDHLLVRKGEKIPVDGVIIEGIGYLNEAMLTGETKLIEKQLGDEIIGGTVNAGEAFYMEAKKVGSETVLANILKKVQEIQSQKPKLQRIADRIAKWFTPFILLVAIIAFVVQYFHFYPNDLSHAINIAIAVIVIACPCALGIATPLAVAIGTNKAVKEGVLFNNAEVFEKITKLDAIAFDKTGTITTGELTIKRILGPVDNYPYIYNLEKLSSHPIAKSIIRYFSTPLPEIKFSNVSETAGLGISGQYDNQEYLLTSYKKALTTYYIDPSLKAEVERLATDSPILIVLVVNNTISNVLFLADTIREDAKQTIANFKKHGIGVYMISGDNLATTARIAKEVGITNYYANVSPIDKANIIKEIQSNNKTVGYVGDGINDIVALEQSDFGISMGQGSEVAIQASDITIIKPDIFNIYKALVATKLTRKIIWWNFFWAFGYNLVTIPLAIVGFIPPIVGAIVMGVSDITVLTNSLIFYLRKVNFNK
ncbi:heavy metal translocating P-type ATPase [Spiroplasma sp. DGKH1]|uniref:heavy metal translocating P-type ATPase n=1 Tax=Spiroplasma sp. DGKH1 TaxID=3050074 RepID=UPI0034C68845